MPERQQTQAPETHRIPDEQETRRQGQPRDVHQPSTPSTASDETPPDETPPDELERRMMELMPRATLDEIREILKES